MSDLQPPLAVVPILINTGAALLPALIAGVASLAAILFKPKELLRICRRHPGRAATVLLMIAGLTALIAFWPSGAGSPSPRSSSAAAHVSGTTDWTRVALELIKEEQRTRARGEVPLSLPSRSTEISPSSTASFATNFRGNFERTGYTGGPAPATLVPVWEYEEEFAMFLSSPVVHGGKVYATWCLLDPPHSYGAVVCLDTATGDLLWITEETAEGKPFKGIFSSPAVSGDGRSVVVGQGLHPDANCDVICLDALTGQIRWLAPTKLHVESSPAIEGGLVVVGAGAIESGADHRPSGHPGYVLGIDLASGRILWEHDVADPESSPAIAGGVAFIGSGFNGQAVVALRTDSSESLAAAGLSRELWRREAPHPVTGAITAAGNVVLAGCGNGDFVMAAKNPEGAVLAIDRETGALLWSVAMPDAVLGPIAVRGNLAICPVRNGEVIALDLAKKGEIVWRQRISGTAAILGGPAVTDHLVYATSQDGYLGVLSLRDGSLLEKHYLNDPRRPGAMGMTLSAPFVSAGHVYVGSETGGIRVFTGQPYAP